MTHDAPAPTPPDGLDRQDMWDFGDAEDSATHFKIAYHEVHGQLTAAKQENERLKTALDKIVHSSPFSQRPQIIDFARAALERERS